MSHRRRLDQPPTEPLDDGAIWLLLIVAVLLIVSPLVLVALEFMATL